MHLAIVGGGLAGVLLAWRLTRSPHRLRPELYISEPRFGTDATGASGGLIRGFEADPAQCFTAAESLAELLASPVLQAWAGYREVGSVYALRAGTDPGALLMTVAGAVPGSVCLATPSDLVESHPLRQLPGSVVCVIERRAGFLSPECLRTSVLRELANGLTIHRDTVDSVMPDPGVRLERSDLPTRGLRTRQIQYVACSARLPGVGAFVDETSGLYGRPGQPGTVLLGLPCDRWDTEPDAVRPDVDVTARILEQAAVLFGTALTSASPDRVVAALDCYTDPPALRLRSVLPDSPLYTFTGGSGASAKTVLAASRSAAAALAPRQPNWF
jgi:glycine/D-amino acid oxidase-like deaminating enzyme